MRTAMLGRLSTTVPWRPSAPALDDAGARLAHRPPQPAAHTGLMGGAVYETSKRPLSLLTRSWAAEYGLRGVNVSELAAGLVRTAGTDGGGVR